MKVQRAVIERITDIVVEKGITFNEAAIRSGVPPSTLKNILYGTSKNVGIVTIKKLCDGLDISLQQFFNDSIFTDLDSEL